VRHFLGEKEGDIIELETGKKLGKHKGFWFHTIGQRKGLGLSGGPWFVIRKDIEQNIVYVSNGYDNQKAYGNEFSMRDFHFITENPWQNATEGVEVSFKIRHTPEFITGRIYKQTDDRFHLESDQKLQGIAPGQFGVIYDREQRLVIGSGEIVV
jgi:tRNA-specific 2-thiouridylase